MLQRISRNAEMLVTRISSEYTTCFNFPPREPGKFQEKTPRQNFCGAHLGREACRIRRRLRKETGRIQACVDHAHHCWC